MGYMKFWSGSDLQGGLANLVFLSLMLQDTAFLAWPKSVLNNVVHLKIQQIAVKCSRDKT